METVELLSREETRRKVSIDYTLGEDARNQLMTADGVVVPISVLAKEKRRNFDLRDESGSAVPVLGREQNGDLAHLAVMNAVHAALPKPIDSQVFGMLWADLRQVVVKPPLEAGNALNFIAGAADSGDKWRAAVIGDPVSRTLLSVLANNYVLFAVVDPSSADRRVLKYAYGDDFDFGRLQEPWRERWRPSRIAERMAAPDRYQFIVMTPGAGRAASFHLEVVVPEELRIDFASLYNTVDTAIVGDPDLEQNRASLYSPAEIQDDQAVDGFVDVALERAGWLTQAAWLSALISLFLWAGGLAGVDPDNPDAATSILLAGAALFSGLTALRGEHRLVLAMFSKVRRWLVAVAILALVASASLALGLPAEPSSVWLVAAALCSVATIRLTGSAIRAPGL